MSMMKHGVGEHQHHVGNGNAVDSLVRVFNHGNHHGNGQHHEGHNLSGTSSSGRSKIALDSPPPSWVLPRPDDNPETSKPPPEHHSSPLLTTVTGGRAPSAHRHAGRRAHKKSAAARSTETTLSGTTSDPSSRTIAAPPKSSEHPGAVRPARSFEHHGRGSPAFRARAGEHGRPLVGSRSASDATTQTSSSTRTPGGAEVPVPHARSPAQLRTNPRDHHPLSPRRRCVGRSTTTTPTSLGRAPTPSRSALARDDGSDDSGMRRLARAQIDVETRRDKYDELYMPSADDLSHGGGGGNNSVNMNYSVGNSTIRTVERDDGDPATTIPRPTTMAIVHRSDPDTEEQRNFEQRLCEDGLGVGVRKINHSGRSQLRHVRCVPLASSAANDAGSYAAATIDSAASRSSRGSLRRLFSLHRRGADRVVRDADGASATNLLARALDRRSRALAWGHRKRVFVPLDHFVAVRKGRTTERTRRCAGRASRLLSLITDLPAHPSLDIEAPTRLDRDKFARAFARFLSVPLVEGDDDDDDDDNGGSSKKDEVVIQYEAADPTGTLPAATPASSSTTAREDHDDDRGRSTPDPHIDQDGAEEPGTPRPRTAPASKSYHPCFDPATSHDDTADEPLSPRRDDGVSPLLSLPPSLARTDDPPPSSSQRPTSTSSADGGASDVSSITAGFDQEVVEELHHALNELRAELEASRAEAARAVKVAEQAIQSAEDCSSSDWNSTVTHKAAEAAAQAQRRSAEAMARQRLAEERLQAERRSAAFWRRQAEAAEEEAGASQTRAAAAEVRRAAVAEELERERRETRRLADDARTERDAAEARRRDDLAESVERNRALDVSLEATKRDYLLKCEEVRTLEENLQELQNSARESTHAENARISKEKWKKFNRLGRRKNRAPEPADDDSYAPGEGSSLLLGSENVARTVVVNTTDLVTEEKLRTLHKNSLALRNQFEMLRRSMAEELRALPHQARDWTAQIARALAASRYETKRLRGQLSYETALRRKLHHEVQDLRGNVRVYCRPRPSRASDARRDDGVVSVPSHQIINLRRDLSAGASGGVAERGLSSLIFEYDRVFQPDSSQSEVYSETEELVLGALDGYVVCVMAFGQSGSGKTHTILGECGRPHRGGRWIDRDDPGVYFQTLDQLLTVARHRSERYQDSFSVTILEVAGERLCDLCAGTRAALARGEARGGGDRPRNGRGRRGAADEASAGSPHGVGARGGAKLEIRTNYDGDTVVQGLTSIPVRTMDEVWNLWDECLARRAARSTAGSAEPRVVDSHIIATVNVVSTNIATGVGTVGKIQFVDLAGADVVPRRARSTESAASGASRGGGSWSNDGLLTGVVNGNVDYRFSNKSIATLSEVVHARCQFTRSVPYRNSTLTHLLRDCLEGDAKVLMFVCLSSEEEDLQASATSLKLASRMRQIEIGKATKHTVSLA